MRRISSRSWPRTLASRADSGSSSSSRRGSAHSARAKRDPLLLAAGELVGEALGHARQTDEIEQFAGTLAALGRRDLAHLEPEGDVVQGVHVREQAVGLEDHAEVAPVRRQVR